MHRTYLNMLSISELYQFDCSLPEMALMMKNQDMPVLLSNLYVRQYPALCRIADRFKQIDDSDKGSISVEQVYKAAMDYDVHRGVKLETLTSKYFYNALHLEMRRLTAEKRLADVISLDGCNILVFDNEFMGALELENTLGGLGLSKREMEFCLVVIRGTKPYTFREISSEMGVSLSMVQYIRDRLRIKLSPRAVLGG